MTGSSTQRRADRRVQLLDAACRTISRVGARGMRVEDVAAEAGVAPSLVYYYFADRRDLLTEAFRHTTAVVETDLTEIPGQTGRDRLTHYLLSEVDEDVEGATNWAFWSELMAAAVFDSTLREPITDAYGHWISRIASHIHAGQADGSIAAGVDADIAAEQLSSLMDGVASRWVMGDISSTKARTISSAAIDSLLRAD